MAGVRRVSSGLLPVCRTPFPIPDVPFQVCTVRRFCRELLFQPGITTQHSADFLPDRITPGSEQNDCRCRGLLATGSSVPGNSNTDGRYLSCVGPTSAFRISGKASTLATVPVFPLTAYPYPGLFLRDCYWLSATAPHEQEPAH